MTHSQLSKLLKILGFKRRVIRGSHTLFTHESTDTVLMFPIVHGGKKVRPTYIMSTGFLLDAKGILARTKWTELVQGLFSKRLSATSKIHG